QDLVALGVGACEPHGVEVGFRPRAHEAHLLGAGHRVHDLGGEADTPGVVGEERSALGGHLLHDLHHLRVGVADDHRAGAQEIVDVLVAAHVPDVAGPPLGNDYLVGHIAEATTRKHAPGGLD